MEPAWQILLAAAIDLAVGDPRWLPHPVRAMGLLASRAEGFFRNLLPPRTAGILTTITVVAASTAGAASLLYLAGWIHPRLEDTLAVALLFTTISLRDLVDHSRRVHLALEGGDLHRARSRVAMMVGRETTSLDRQGVIRATVESVAENLADGVVAPLLYAALGGPVAALAFKAVSTMDSMFGYKNDRYREFGWLPARLDDLANFLPARISGLLLAACAPLAGGEFRRALSILRRDRLKHASPNSGHPEAAMAGLLNIQLGGPGRYAGKMVDKPVIGDPKVPPQPGHILTANRAVLAAGILAALFAAAARFFLYQ